MDEADLLIRADRTLRGAGWSGVGPALVVSGAAQRLYCLGRSPEQEPASPPHWPVSTGAAGFGAAADSGRTPTGLHRICERIGAGAPLGAVFKGRRPTGQIAPDIGPDGDDGPGGDLITTRILWLDGLEPGVNSGPGVDSRQRYIYIHGTPHAAQLGAPASAGCVRMSNAHIAALFDRVDIGALVLIIPPTFPG